MTPEKLQDHELFLQEALFSLVTAKEEGLNQLDAEEVHFDLVAHVLQLDDSFFSVTPEKGLDQLDDLEKATDEVDFEEEGGSFFLVTPKK